VPRTTQQSLPHPSTCYTGQHRQAFLAASGHAAAQPGRKSSPDQGGRPPGWICQQELWAFASLARTKVMGGLGGACVLVLLRRARGKMEKKSWKRVLLHSPLTANTFFRFSITTPYIALEHNAKKEGEEEANNRRRGYTAADACKLSLVQIGMSTDQSFF
jgi:hypothetical protein